MDKKALDPFVHIVPLVPVDRLNNIIELLLVVVLLVEGTTMVCVYSPFHS